MNLTKEILELNKSYIFDVTWGDSGNKFAGKLSLSPHSIKLKFMGELKDGREFPFFFKEVDKLICSSWNENFILHNVKPINGTSRNIDSYPESISFFECEYTVGYMIYLPTSYFNEHQGFDFIDIHSDVISSWIGVTNKQQEIIHRHAQGDSFFGGTESLNQVSLSMDNGCFISLGYNITTYYSLDEFSVGLKFPPSLTLNFYDNEDSVSIKNKFDDLYALLTFFIGNDFPIKLITLGLETYRQTIICSLYFPTEILQTKERVDYSLFPLGHDLAFNSLGLPALPLTAFNSFFLLELRYISIFKKYIKYKRMQSAEEKFLGYFRLLESLCHQTKHHINPDLLSELISRSKPYMTKVFNDRKGVHSFLRGLPRYNKSKYNTEKCIVDFYKRIPASLSSKWAITLKDIQDICTLRNDITHANDFYIEEFELIQKTAFVEVLLVFAMGEKIDINIDVMSSVIHRLRGYTTLIKYEV